MRHAEKEREKERRAWNAAGWSIRMCTTSIGGFFGKDFLLNYAGLVETIQICVQERTFSRQVQDAQGAFQSID